MIGSDEKSWSSLHNVIVPALIAWTEASWVSAWVSALANAGPRTPADVPFLALAIPAVFAAVLSGLSARLPWPPWCRRTAIAAVVLVATAVSAGTIGMLYLHGSFSAISAHPWTVTGTTPSAEASLAWFVAALALARGTWLGWQEPSAAHALAAVAISTLAFTVFFVVGALHHADVSFHPQMGLAIVLLLVPFPGAMAVAAIVIELDLEQELERTSRSHRRPRPELAWLGAVAVPLAAVAVAGVLLALGIGFLAPFVGRLVRAVALWVAAVIGDFARWLAHFFHAVKRAPGPLVGRSGAPLRQGELVVHIPLWIWLVAAAIGAVGAGILGFFVLRLLVRALRRKDQPLGKPRKQWATPLDAERESVFSWGHLLDQILGLARSLFGRLRRAGGDVGPATAPRANAVANTGSVRHHYRRVLVAARAAGHGREVSETPLELQGRLSAVTGAGTQLALQAMTTAYERVRYGEEPDSEEQAERAARDAEVLVTALLDTLAQG